MAKNFTDTVKTKAMGQNVINAIKPQELMVKIVHDELVELMGTEAAPVNLKGAPAVILMSGLQGSGKTTFTGKLAKSSKARKAVIRCWSHAMCTVRQPSSSSRCWRHR